MVLPLYLAMTEEEMAGTDRLPPHFGVFDPVSPPPGAMVILTDRFPCPASMPECESVLLDFERKADEDSRKAANALLDVLPCPVAAPPDFARDSDCAVFLPPCPLHVPLAEYLRPWQGREIWLDVTLGQQIITVTREGTRYSPAVPADRRGGKFDDMLMCQCVTEISENAVTFTLFDTPETLKMKLAEAARYGVTRAVGLYQELGGSRFIPIKECRGGSVTLPAILPKQNCIAAGDKRLFPCGKSENCSNFRREGR